MAFPHLYRVHLEPRAQATVVMDGSKPILVGGPPPESGGRPHWWSPEHLLASSLGLCFTATFQALAARTELSPRRYEADVETVLDKTTDGLQFVSFTIRVVLEVAPGQIQLAADLLEKARHHCLVAKGLKAPVALISVVSVTSASPPASRAADRWRAELEDLVRD
jgi:organic hydroperoxide reductase OsmC/OhrA